MKRFTLIALCLCIFLHTALTEDLLADGGSGEGEDEVVVPVPAEVPADDEAALEPVIEDVIVPEVAAQPLDAQEPVVEDVIVPEVAAQPLDAQEEPVVEDVIVPEVAAQPLDAQEEPVVEDVIVPEVAAKPLDAVEPEEPAEVVEPVIEPVDAKPLEGETVEKTGSVEDLIEESLKEVEGEVPAEDDDGLLMVPLAASPEEIPEDEPQDDVQMIARADSEAGDDHDHPHEVITIPPDPTLESALATEKAVPAVPGAPAFQVDCPTSKVVPLGAKIDIRCKVTSDTDISSTYFYWHQYLVVHLKDNEVTPDHEYRAIENNSSRILLTPVEQSNPLQSDNEDGETALWARDSGYFGLVYSQDDGSAVMELRIPHMVSQMYRRHFFVAENDKGSSEYIVEFRRDPKDKETNSATSVTSSLLSFFVISAFTIFLH